MLRQIFKDIVRVLIFSTNGKLNFYWETRIIFSLYNLQEKIKLKYKVENI